MRAWYQIGFGLIFIWAVKTLQSLKKMVIDPVNPIHYPNLMKVSAQYAADHLDALLTAAQNGEDVQIASPDQASFRLTLVAPAPRQTSAKRILGAGVGEMIVPTDEKWRKMKEETASLMNDGPLFPSSEEWAQSTGGSDWRFPERPRSELFGCLKGKLVLSEDWDSPETNQAVADLFENSRIFPDTSAQ